MIKTISFRMVEQNMNVGGAASPPQQNPIKCFLSRWAWVVLGVTALVIFVLPVLQVQSVSTPPVADARVSASNTFPAATSKTLTVGPGGRAFLWGEGSSAGTRFYNWGCTGGALDPSTSNPANSAGRNPIWTAPSVSWRTTFICALNVSDGTLFAQNFDFAYITVDNGIAPPSRNPIADARVTSAGVGLPDRANDIENIALGEGQTANLWGAWSFDPDAGMGPALNNYGWTCTGGSISPASQNQFSSTAINPVWTAPSLPAGVQSQTYACLLNVGDGQLGALQLDQVTMTVQRPSAPEASITADAVSIPSGQSTTIRWCGSNSHVCANATSCSVGTFAGGNNISGQCSGIFQTGALTSNRTYFLSTSGPGGSNSASVTVNVVTQTVGAPTLSISGACPNISMNWTLVDGVSGSNRYTMWYCQGNSCPVPPGGGWLSAGSQNTPPRLFSNRFYEQNGPMHLSVAANFPNNSSTFSNIVDSTSFCALPPTAFVQASDRNNVVIATGSETSPFPSGTTKANGVVNLFAAGSNAASCTIGTSELAEGTFVRAGLSAQCTSEASCRDSGFTLQYPVSGLTPKPVSNAPIDQLTVFGLCTNIRNESAVKFLTVSLMPGDFSLAQPTNTCVPASTIAPVALQWTASPAADRYNVFRVIDANSDGIVQQSEVDAADNGGNLNFDPQNPSAGLSRSAAQCDTDITCNWTDPTAVKNTRYLYIVRARNAQGVTFSDTPTATVLADLRMKAHTTTCVPAPRISAQPAAINFGQSSILTWGTENSFSCSIDQGIGLVCGNVAACDEGGTSSVSPADNTTYTLSCVGAGITRTASTMVAINNRAPAAVAGVSSNTSTSRTYARSIRVRQGENVRLFFAPFVGRFSDFSTIPLADKSNDPDGNGHATKGILNGGKCEWNSDLSSAVNPNTGVFDFDAAVDDTITLGGVFPDPCMFNRIHRFDDAGGDYTVLRLKDILNARSNTANVTIIAVPAPLISSFTATPNSINQGQAFSLAWTSTGTINCRIDQGVGAVASSGSREITGLNISPKTYTLACDSTDTDLYPTPATQTVTVRINQCVAMLTPSRTSVPTPGDPITLSWSATNARSCSITGVTPAPICSADQVCSVGGTTGSIAISSARTFTLSCSGDAGACSATTPTVSVANQAPSARAGASTNISVPRSYSNTITVTQNVATDIFLSAGPTIDGAAGSSDSDGSLTRCDWNTDFGRSPPITFENNDVISPPGDIADCDRTVASRIFTEPPTVPGTPNIYPLLRVTDNQGATADATLRVNILPNLAVALSADAISGNAPFSPTLRADITTYTGAASDNGNFSIWWDCTNTSADIGVVSNPNACGPLPSDPISGDRICGKNANGAKCDGVPLQGQEFLTTVVDPAYAARATAYSPKIIVERGSARSVEARASATANTPFAYTLTKTGGDIDVVKGASGNTTIAFDHTAGAAQRVDFSCSSGLPVGATCSFTPSNCTSDCATTMTINTTASTPAGGPTAIIISGSVGGGNTASAGLTVRDTLPCAPATQSAVVGVPTASITAIGGTGTNLWEVFHPSNLLARDPNASPNTGSGATFSTTFGTAGNGRIIRVTSGSQTVQCTADVTGQTLAVAISAVPDSGTAPLVSTITGQITSGSTAIGTINYSFWWDCTNTSNNVSNVINGTAGGAACGNPEGAIANLATNYPQIICKGNAAGAKCDGINPASVTGFDPVSNPLRVAHTYGASTASYKPKVIIERGSAPAAEARYTSGVMVSFPALTASCSVAPVSALTGANVTWTATPGGGSGAYTYGWTGDVPLQGRIEQAPVAVYTTAGNKSGTVTVTDTVTGITRTASCGPVAVSLPPNGAPVAVAGMSKDTSSTRSYSPSVDVKFGVPTPLYFSAFVGTKVSPTPGQISTDPDGWPTPEGVSNGGHCDWNVELRQQAPPVYPDARITSPASATACEASRSNPISSPYTFNDLPQNDAQISRAFAYNILQITDNRGTVSNDGQASVVVHYAPEISSFTANGASSASVNSGAPVTLTWGSKHATSCVGTGFDTGNAPSGTRTVNPTQDTTYSVSCSGSPLWGATVASVSVVINAPIVNLQANGQEGPITVATGSNIDLTWTSTNASSCTGTNFNTGATSPAQSTGMGIRVNPATATTYTITCTGTNSRTATDNVVVNLANSPPVAVAGVSKDTNASRTYRTAEDVKFGVPTPLYFSAFLGPKSSPTSQSSDPDGWTDTQNGVSSGGNCAFNLDLSRTAPTTYEQSVSNPPAPVSCEVSQASHYTFSDGADNDAQISKPLTYNIARITDRPGSSSNEAQSTINIHYAPEISSFTANGASSASVNSGAPVTLTWGSKHATSCVGTGFDTGNAPSGTRTVNPTQDTTYSVSCSGSPLWGATVASVSVVMTSTYSLAASRDITVVQGATAGNTNTITVRRETGSSQAPVSLAAGGLPTDATASFTPSSCLPASAPCASTLAIATSRGAEATPAGTYPITVTGSANGTPVATAVFNLVVTSQMGVVLSALPSPTGPAPYVLQLKADAPAVEYTGKPEDRVNYWFWKNCDNAGTNVAAVTNACGVPDYRAENTPDLSVTTTDLIYTQQGAYRAKVITSRGSATAEDRIAITVNPPFGYALSLDRSRVELVQGTSASSANRATVAHESGTPVSLTFGSRVAGVPASTPNPAISFSPSSCTPPVGGSCGADISVGVSRELPAGDYPVTVSAGSQNTSFTLGVISRINAQLTALPTNNGAAPLSVQLKADTSGYTGSSNDALNYSFWWDCNNPTDSPSAARTACGDPQNEAIGYKTDGTLQESLTTPSAHVYTTEGVYVAKIIVERGGARREARISITVGTPKVSVSCSASPASAVLNQPIIWTAVPARGVAPYGFNWTRDVSCGINPQNCGLVEMRYATAGDKFGLVTVTDGNGDTASRLCDNAVKIYQPTLVIVPPTAQIRADGDTMQFAAKYDPDGPDGSQPEQTVTTNAVWSIPLSEQSRATVSAGGLVTTRAQTGNVTLTASFRDSFNNVILATAAIVVIPRDALVCDPATQTVRTGERTFPMKASGGTGSYDWLVQEIDATPRTGSTVGSQTFAPSFSVVGNKTVTVTSGSQSGSCRVTVTDQNLSVNLSAFPTVVTVPQTTRLTAVVSGNALGTMNYSWWWDCGSEKDADDTTRVEIAEGRCGEIPHNVPAGQCQENQYGAACHELSVVSKAIDHGYADAGSKRPKVIVERGSAAPAQAKATVTVDAANQKPDAVAGISADVNATRLYARSIVVTQNVPTRIYFAGFTGRVNAVDEKSTDPNGWANELNGVYHPNNQSATGKCAWNADLDRDAQVSFEDVSGTNRNPESEKECITSFVHNFAEVGTYTYAVLRITDNRGAVSEPALVTVDVVSPGAPVSVPGVSADPSANRIYRDVVRVKQGESTELWVSARRRVGASDIVSSDPDGWKSKNGGVAKGGSCRWNRDLDKGVFPTGVPTYEYTINDPQDPSEDCDTKIVNEAGNSFTRVFLDAPREEPYSFEALRIFDNTGLRSNKGMINVQVLPSDPPTAVVSASTNNGATFNDTITVVRGAPTPIIFSAAGSTDPDGWTNPVNGVSASGHCDWNTDLNQGTPTFEMPINTPSSPSVCNLPSRTYTFNDRPGVINLDLLKITDNKGFTSVSPGGVSVRVTAPDIVVSEGPLPSSVAALVEKGNVSFTGKIKNQGDAATATTFNAVFRIDLGNDGSNDLTIAPNPVIAGLAAGGERSVVSGTWSNLPAGTHKITLCADQPNPAVGNEFFTENNCSSQVITVIPDNRSPVAETGISLDGITYGASITVLKGAPVQIWLSADKDTTGDAAASFDPDGWTDATRGVASGGKCEWNIDLAPQFAVQNTVNNPASPAICNRNRMDKTFNDPAGTYIYPVLQITDAKLGQSNVANVSVRVVDSAANLNHIDCVAEACVVVSGAGANICAVPGGACTGGSGGPSGNNRADLMVSEAPHRASGKLEEGKKATFAARVKNQGVGAVTLAFNNTFLVDLGNDGSVNVRLPASSRTARTKVRAQLAALPISDLILPLPAAVPELGAGADVSIESGEWRNIPAGTHRIIVCADSDSAVTESDEMNNCDSTVVTVPPSGNAGGPLRVDSCTASPRDVRAGEFVDWSATASGGNGGYSFSWSGDAPLEGATANPVSIKYQTTGTKSGSVIITSGNETASRSCGTVNVTPGIISFSANPTQINPGQSSLLTWNTVGFSSCVITADQPGQGLGAVAASGTQSVQPAQNTRYTLTCVGASQSQSVTVVVSSQPVIQEVVPQ